MSVAAILDRLDEAAEGRSRVCVGDIVKAMGDRGFGPFLLVPALIEVSPIGGIPTVPTILASLIALVAIQIVIGRDHLWLPGFVERRSLRAGRFETAVERLRPLGTWLDRWFHGRLSLFVSKPFVRGAALIAILACLTVPALEFIPFASTIPMAVVIALGLAITVKDGLLMMLAYAGTIAGIYGLWMLVG